MPIGVVLFLLVVVPVLVAAFRGKRGTRGEETVHLATAENEAEAAIWRDMLSNAGIKSMQRTTDPLYSGAFGGVISPAPYSIELFVRAADVGRAREVLSLRRSRRRRP